MTTTTYIDCARCTAKPSACSDCVISVLLGMSTETEVSLELDTAEQAALAALASSGLIPHLRLVAPPPATSALHLLEDCG